MGGFQRQLLDHSLFSYPERTAPSMSLWSASARPGTCHIHNTIDRQAAAYHTLNKRGHIPDVFPHGTHPGAGGKSGILGFHWGLAAKDTSSAQGLISAVCIFPKPLFCFSVSLPFSPSLPPPPPPPPLNSSSSLMDLWGWCLPTAVEMFRYFSGTERIHFEQLDQDQTLWRLFLMLALVFVRAGGRRGQGLA